MLVRLALACLLSAFAVRPVLAQDDLAALRAPIQALLADEAALHAEVPAKLKGMAPPPSYPWPDPNVVLVPLTASGALAQGYAAVDTAAKMVVGFAAAEPKGPVPMEAMPAEQALPIAEAFCRRQLPELWAAGGEVKTTTDDKITLLGARMVHLQRTVQGVNVPTLADVGVRVYDGKVACFRRRHVPLDPNVKLPGTVTLDRAKEVATQKLPGNTLEPVLWFDLAHEVVVAKDGQRNVWTLWAETKTKNTRERILLEGFYHWQIDANTEEVVSIEYQKPTHELYFRYLAAGGKHVPFSGPLPHDPAFGDDAPVYSPDGTRLLFTSTRPRNGYPAWLQRPAGLLVVNTDGSDLKCVVPGAAARPCWSPDGTRVAYLSQRRLYVAPGVGGASREFAPPKGSEYLRATWAGNQQLVAYALNADVTGGLVMLNADQADAPPKALGARHGLNSSFGALVVSPDGKTLIYTLWEYKTADDQWDLLKLDLSAEGATPQVICENPRQGGTGQLIGTGRVLLWGRSPEVGVTSPMWIVDLATGQPTQFKPPSPDVPGARFRTALQPTGVCFSPDGQRLAFAARIWDNDPTHAPATVIWTCKLDGSDVKQVTAWDDKVVPLAGP